MQDPMQPPEQNPGPDPGPNPGPGPGPGAGEQPGPPMPGPMPGQYPGPGPGPYPGSMPGQRAGGGPGLSDPSAARQLRLLVIVLSLFCVAALIKGTVTDEYIGYVATPELSRGEHSQWYGCQNIVVRYKYKYSGPTDSAKLTFNYMNKLSFIIILTTSLLCVLQAVAVVLNVVVLLLGKLHKAPLILNSVVTFLLLAAIVFATINFSERRFASQYENIDAYHQEILDARTTKAPPTTTRAPLGRRRRSPGDHRRDSELEDMIRYKSKLAILDSWGQSYHLICVAFVVAVINQILLMALHKIAKNDGVTTLRAFVKTSLNRAKIVHLVIFLVNLLLLAMMVTGMGLDSYIDGGLDNPCLIGAMNNGCNGKPTEKDGEVISKKVREMNADDRKKFYEDQAKYNRAGIVPPFINAHTTAIVLFVVTLLTCILLVAAIALCIVQMVMDKNLAIPLLGVSGGAALLLLISVIVAGVEFQTLNHNSTIDAGKRNFPDLLLPVYGPRSKKDLSEDNAKQYTEFAISFHILCVALTFALVNAGLNAANMFLSKKGENGPAKPAPATMKVSSTQPSSTGVGPSPLEATCQNPTASA